MKVISRDQHSISNKDISDNALNIISGLSDRGHEAYLVGGAVRDLLLGRIPKDFDVATSATPEEIRKIFRRARVIGRRFRITHIRCGRELIEVTTFRGNQQKNCPSDVVHEEFKQSSRGLLLRDNVFGTMKEDATRRDITVNALYYDPEKFSIIDHTGGLNDLSESKINVIGNPSTRFIEDPVRILRVIRFATKLNFNISSNTAKSIPTMSPFLAEIPSARLFDEFLKLFFSGNARNTLESIINYSLLDYFFPDLQAQMTNQSKWSNLIKNACADTDLRIYQNKSVAPAFLLAVMLWPRLSTIINKIPNGRQDPFTTLQSAISKVIAKSNSQMAIPKRFSTSIREIWEMQYHLEHSKRQKAIYLMTKRRFRAGYDLLVLRERVGDCSAGLENRWNQLQNNHKKL
ncbi:MAG: polynucleotide adenylyltransferase PcnB [Halieaceae bacterium]|nr:polynucleotide adenylyltransferase PcnB [Halieaceae bacterium]